MDQPHLGYRKAGEQVMNQDMFQYVDHTLLLVETTWDEIKEICDDAAAYKVAAVCIPPSYVKRAKEYLAGQVRVCTVIGFPNGYSTSRVKVFEAEDAIENGAEEIDMVINIGDVKDGAYDRVEEEIRQVKAVCGSLILKVIIETCLLTDEEKIRMCHVITSAGADFIKTSTGFSKSGASLEDIKLFSEHIGKGVRMKAAGGIETLEDARQFLELGVSRLGTSRLIKLAKAEKIEEGTY